MRAIKENRFRINSPQLKVGDVIVKVDPKYYRPAEVDYLLGDSYKAKKELKWEPKFTFDQLVLEECDFYLADFNNKEASDLKICNTLFWREVIYN